MWLKSTAKPKRITQKQEPGRHAHARIFFFTAIRGVDKQASLRQVVRGTAVQPLAVDYRHQFIVVQLATGTSTTYESHE